MHRVFLEFGVGHLGRSYDLARRVEATRTTVLAAEGAKINGTAAAP